MNDILEHDPAVHDEWPLRPWLLAGIGAVAGLAVWLLLDVNEMEAWRAALAAFVFFAALAAAFVLRPERLVEAIVFSLGLGVVMGGIAFLAVDSGDHLAGEEFAFAAGVFFSILAIPLFQADFHRRRWTTPYAEAHFHVWTDAVSAGGALAFMLLSFALLWLLHGLFSLVGITIIEELIEDGWFLGMFFGATFGAAVGVLRNQLNVIGTLQRVVMLVFSLLAVPFAAAILVFLAILLFTGGAALFEATDSATPVLLACAVGCFVLANAVMRDDDAARSSSVVMQGAALMLAFAIFPLTVFAAISMGIRIGQHGLSPERLWALVAIAIATAYGLAYWVGLARGRLAGWAHHLRRANLHLAVGSCLVAFILAFPLVDFGAISANNQLARLRSGEVSAEEFDFAALRWDFGDAGRRALDRLAAGDGDVAQLAGAAREEESRGTYVDRGDFGWESDGPPVRFARPDAPMNEPVRRYLRANPWTCSEECVALALDPLDGDNRVVIVSRSGVQEVRFNAEWVPHPPAPEVAPAPREGPLTPETVELRPWTGRQVHVNGQPVGQPME